MLVDISGKMYNFNPDILIVSVETKSSDTMFPVNVNRNATCITHTYAIKVSSSFSMTRVNESLFVS